MRARGGTLSAHDRLGLVHILTGSGLGVVFALLPNVPLSTTLVLIPAQNKSS